MYARMLILPVIVVMVLAAPIGLMAQTSGSPYEFSLEVGTRTLLLNLLDDKKGEPQVGSFIGSINRLEDDPNYLPLHPYVQALVAVDSFQFGGGISYGNFRVDTRDDGGGDGSIDSQYFNFYGIATYDAYVHFRPYVEIGLSIVDNSFDPKSEWSRDGLNTFKLDSSVAPYLAAGCNFNIDDHWAVDVYLRYMDLDVDGTYIFTGDDRAPEPFTFTLEHFAYGVGVCYTF